MDNEKKPATTTEKKTEQEAKNDDVPFIKSPYLDYDNLEGNKMRTFGAEGGQQEAKVGLTGGLATDAPTPSGGVGRGGGAASADLSSTGAINRQGVP
ncbi:hypothetical protein AALP_AA6G285900 [Arabis alpina]|uniref:Uncharacterized protein n=1 Tax=Arabis alpina TaxID=50452 RepID=A0A087GSB3_ARAAL|nr:hypothetical protein AALP_AA6G285900 [Arabis alpina]